MESSIKIPLGQIENIDKDTVGLGNVDNIQQIPLADKGANNGVAELDSNGKVPVSQLPSYVSDVETYPTLSSFPATGVDNIIYITEDTNLTYRWTGSAYVEISPSIALGETSSTAYRGDRGKTAYDHSQLTSGNPHNVTKTDVGLSNVDNTSDANKPISTATQNALNGKVSSISKRLDRLGDGVDINNSDPQNPKIGLQDRLPQFDGRLTNELPGWYITNYERATITEVKISDTIGLSSIFPSGWCSVTTNVLWSGVDNQNSQPYQTAKSNRNGKMATRYGLNVTTWSPWVEIGAGGGGGSMTITPITYAFLAELKYQNQLVPGVRYYITDRDIWIDALDTDKLAMECKRHFRIVKDEHYTPHTTGSSLVSNYLGIYGQTIARGSVPVSTIISGTRYFAIWGGRMWLRDIIGSDVPGTSGTTIAGGWTMQAVTNDTYYESKIFDIKYNFDDDIIWEQSDDRGNIIKRLNSTTSYIDITDWGCTKIYNNQCIGIFDNFNNGDIFNNSNSSFIFDNSNIGSIDNNSNIGNIRKNRNSGDIQDNSNNGDIQDNLNSGGIYVNSNKGYIQNNSNNGSIYYNSNNGNIDNNTSSSSTSFTIRNNMNNGNIQRNNSINIISIQYNTNNGSIGTGSVTNRSTNVQDNQTNK